MRGGEPVRSGSASDVCHLDLVSGGTTRHVLFAEAWAP